MGKSNTTLGYQGLQVAEWAQIVRAKHDNMVRAILTSTAPMDQPLAADKRQEFMDASQQLRMLLVGLLDSIGMGSDSAALLQVEKLIQEQRR